MSNSYENAANGYSEHPLHDFATNQPPNYEASAHLLHSTGTAPNQENVAPPKYNFVGSPLYRTNAGDYAPNYVNNDKKLYVYQISAIVNASIDCQTNG